MQIGEATSSAGTGSPSPPPGGEEPDTVAASVQWVEIRGLYRPGFDDGARHDDGSGYGCGYEVGYTSGDGRGRVFVNHRPRASASEPWAGARAKDVQYIEMIVQVQRRGGAAAILEIEWRWEDPDDPSDAGMHASAARHVDGNGSAGNDNQGHCDFPRRDASRSPTFAAVSGFAMSGGGTTCRTAIANNESRVRLHLTNAGGDNFRVSARVVGGDSGPVVTTGIMTMWKRLDVEYHQMRGVMRVPVARVVRALEAACVQLDFTTAIDLDHRDFLTDTADYETASAVLAQRLFQHAGQPGWFMLVAADRESRRATGTRQTAAYEGSGTLHSFPPHQWLEIPNTLLDARGVPLDVGAVELRNGSETLTFWCTGRTGPGWPTAGSIGIALRPLTYFNVVTPRHGSVELAHSRPNGYFPMRQAGHQNLGFSSSVQCGVFTGLAIGASGITPTVRRNGREYFVGRTIAFMGRFTDEDAALQTIVHEFCHAFGFAHSCGRTAANPSSGHACTMAILDHWVFRPGTGTLQRWHPPPRGPELCEYHLRGMRDTHLEDNPALWRWT
jgi:hypothetical protein